MSLQKNMGLQLKKKVSSETGASITYALLIFLVCTVVGSVVLTAGTAAAGRIAQVARMDQKYYSVSSAVQLLEEELCDKEVTIVRREVKQAGGESSYTTLINGTSYDSKPANTSFLTRQAINFLYGDGDAFNNATAMGYSMYNGNKSTTDFSLSLSGGGTGINSDKLGVTGRCKMRSDGTLRLTVTDQVDSNNNYSLCLILSAHIDEDESVSTTPGSSNPTTTTVKTSRINWSVSGVSKGE